MCYMTMVTDHGHIADRVMKTIKASEFKAKCLALMDEVARTGKPVLVTKRGKPVVELRKPLPRERRSIIGLHAGVIEITGDIMSPIDEDEWEATK